MYLLKFRVIDFTLIFSSSLSSNPFGKYLSRVFYPFRPYSAWNKVMEYHFQLKHSTLLFLIDGAGQRTYEALSHCGFVKYPARSEHLQVPWLPAEPRGA